MSLMLDIYFNKIKNVVIDELLLPKTLLGRTLNFFRFRSNKSSLDSLTFVYDTNVNPVTFDFVEFLAMAQAYRRRKSLGILIVIIVLPESILSKKSFRAVVSKTDFEFRIYEILVGLSKMASDVADIHLVRKNYLPQILDGCGNLFPENYSLSKPKNITKNILSNGEGIFPVFKQLDHAEVIAKDYLNQFKTERIITITLREYGYIKERNSSIDDWLKVAEILTVAGFKVIFIPDSNGFRSNFLNLIKDYEIAYFVCWNVALRASLYSNAFLNLGVVGGPMFLSLYLDQSRTLMFYNHHVYPEDYKAHIRDFWNEDFTRKRPYFCQHQHYVFQKDDANIILVEFLNYFQDNNFELGEHALHTIRTAIQ